MIEAELDKRYPGCLVLSGARMTVERGTVHALVGENGAGKSTLVKIIAGVLRGERGRLVVNGKPVELATWTRQRARAAGIGFVQQHGAFAGTLSVVENAVLGVEPRRGPLLDLDATAQALQALGDKIGLPIDPWARTDTLSLGATQRAEIVAALHHGAKLLILDEPTAVLTPVEVDGLLVTLRTLAHAGTTVVIVTHKLDEVRAVADDVTVLRAGQTVATFGPSARQGDGPMRGVPLDVKAIARAMVGTDLPEPATIPAPRDDAQPALVLDRVSVAAAQLGGEGLGHALVLHALPAALRPGQEVPGPAPRVRGGAPVSDISLVVRGGEIVGVAGVDGNGQRELALAIAGLVPHAGTIQIGARDVTRLAARDRLAAGLAHIPEDRHHGGLFLDLSVADNVTLGRRDITGRFRIDRKRVVEFAGAQIVALDIRPGDPDAVVRSLSGGNQQKVVVARELSRPALAAVVASQPTRGVDLGAVARIHDRLRAAATAGAGVLVISADLDELLALCHRVLVLLRGRIVGERRGAELQAPDARAALGAMMTGAEAA